MKKFDKVVSILFVQRETHHAKRLSPTHELVRPPRSYVVVLVVAKPPCASFAMPFRHLRERRPLRHRTSSSS